MIVIMEHWRSRKIGDVFFGLLAGVPAGIALALLCISFLSGCTADIDMHGPDVSASAKARPSYSADLSACREQARANLDTGEMLAESLIPIYGAVKYFDSSDPSSYSGRHKAIDDCMAAKGYR